MLEDTIGTTYVIVIAIIKIANMYTIITDSPLALLLTIFTFFAFLNNVSNFLAGIYNMYAIIIPTINGIIIFKKFDIQLRISVILSNVLYTIISASTNVNQYNHFVNFSYNLN